MTEEGVEKGRETRWCARVYVYTANTRGLGVETKLADGREEPRRREKTRKGKKEG